MPMSPDDRKQFSLKVVSADGEVATYEKAKAQLANEVAKLQKTDDANKNLFDPVNEKINLYHQEIAKLDGNQREAITEQDIQDAAAVKIRNHFYPNDTTATVPSLAGSNNVWTKAKPFALTYAIGKNYSEAYTVITKEGDLIDAALAFIATAEANANIVNTSGQSVQSTAGTCSLPQYTTQSTCTAGGGTWTPGTSTVQTDTAVHALKTDLVSKINEFLTFLQAEVAVIVSNDTGATQTQNDAAKNNINSIIIPAVNTWLAYPDFQTVPPGTSAAAFPSYNTNLLAPTKLHNVQLTALKTALQNRKTFVTSRIAQLNTVLGSLTQDLSTGDVTGGSGLYQKRYNFMLLRLDLLNGSLSKLTSMKQASGAQDSIISSIKNAKSTYMSVVPTSPLTAPGNGTNTIQVADTSFLAVGDTVYIAAESQEELVRAVKSISGKTVVLNDIVPAKYKTTDKLRIYKDIS